MPNVINAQMNDKTFLAVATLSHLFQTLVAIESARQHCLFQSIYLFVPDAPTKVVDQLLNSNQSLFKDIHVFGPDHIDDPHARFRNTFSYYNVFEAVNLAKYVALQHVIKQNDCGTIIVFSDGDTFYTGSIDETVLKAKTAITIFPHLNAPATIDREHDIMTHGWINGGLMLVRKSVPETDLMIEWLIDRISKRGFLAPELGMFVDQLWVSALPQLFPNAVTIDRNPALNVAYWNLSERPIDFKGNDYTVLQQPLVMFHFSGFDPKNPKQLSNHAQIAIPQGSALEKLARVYSERLAHFKKILIVPLQGKIEFNQHNLERRIKTAIQMNSSAGLSKFKTAGIFTRVGRFLDRLFD